MSVTCADIEAVAERVALEAPCPHCRKKLRMRDVPRVLPQLRGACSACGGLWVLVAGRTLRKRRRETAWLRRKLENAERLARLDDARDLVYSELFVAFEVLVKMLDEYTGRRGGKTLRETVDRLRSFGVIPESRRRLMLEAIGERNRLFHGETVRPESLPLEKLRTVIEDLRWYFSPAEPEV